MNNRELPEAGKLALTVKEAAALLGVSPKVVYDLVHTADFPAFQPTGGKWVVNRAGLQAWLDRHTGARV